VFIFLTLNIFLSTKITISNIILNESNITKFNT